MADFTKGQKLTAQGLNQALERAAGPDNPTGSWKWMGTSSGRLQASWNDFSNSQWQDPDMYTVRISPSLDAPEGLQVNGTPAAALRRVFMYLGATQTGECGKTLTFVGSAGKGVNGCVYPLVIGWQYRDSTSPLGQTGVRWSVFSARKRPQNSDPLAWKNMQDLYTGQTVRCDSQAGLWWTGITLEDCASSDLSSNMLMDIVAYPVFVKCEQESLGVKVTLPLLCVCTLRDYYGHMDAFSAAWNSSLATACGNELAAYAFTPIEAVGNPVPGLLKTVAQYAGRTSTQDEHYRQVTNDLSFDFQFGGNVFEGTNDPAAPYPYILDSFQWEDSDGHHAMAGNYLEACGPDA